MIRTSEEGVGESSSSIVVPSRFLYNRIFSLSSVGKLVLVGILIGIMYLPYSLLSYYAKSNYFSIVIIFVIILFFLVWISSLYFLFSITSTNIEKSVIGKIFPLLLVTASLTAYFAAVIENKAVLLIFSFKGILTSIGIPGVTYELANSVLYVSIIPLLEEFAKIFPLLILLGNYARISVGKKNIVTNLIPTHRTFVLLGAFYGAWFDLFEQFLSFSILSNPPTGYFASALNNQEIIDILINTRTVFPLHSVTSMLLAFGVGFLFISRKNKKKLSSRIIFLLFLLVSVGFHAYWNYNFQVFSEKFIISQLQLMGYVSYGIFGFFAIWILFKVPKICPSCYSEHRINDCEQYEGKTKIYEKKIKKKKSVGRLIDDSTRMMLCPECQYPLYNGQFCGNCWSFPKLQCENCNQVVPAFSRNCWACGSDVPTLHEKMGSSSPPLYMHFSVGFTRILGVGIIIIFAFVFSTIENSLHFLGNTIFLLSVIIALSVSISWYRSSKNRVKSILASINITAIVAFSLLITTMYLSIFAVFLIISVYQIFFGLIGISLILLLDVLFIRFIIKAARGTNLIVI
ncbi:MAG: PrsW family intramembrane metalloprotease [Candidatus Heimdallarchaeota archaeon]|nr:PrsW family intramembrane metalloprotease [Candidatus Heimdallarchaeota archaeon]MCG3256475.1 PrsW family intramembrane metalloprotease [Candidatus Heimdallarchaeota archaeon]MCK4611540.1 PrsW family intramembrane metalloprotease [Candidatus Heimdallarchaeota archaeon]